MPDAMWIAGTAGCGGDMKFQSGDPPSYVCQDCGQVHEAAAAYTTTGPDSGGEEGIIDELGLYDDLLRCFERPDPWLEYGVVEFRYRQMFPGRFSALKAERGHRHFPVGSKTASKLIGQALGILAARGALVKHVGGPGTGFWHYNDPSHWYALPPGPPLSKLVTWAGFLVGELDGVERNKADVMSERALRNPLPGASRRPAAEIDLLSGGWSGWQM